MAYARKRNTRAYIARITGAFLMLLVFVTAILFPADVLADENQLSDMSGQLLFYDIVSNPYGNLQSACITSDYIITIVNNGDESEVPDVVSAYYRNDHDEYGDPVAQYTLAKRNENEVWEHGNSMCYNPYKDEIYVALYTHLTEETRGCLFVMDPHTLEKKGSIKVSDNFNILAIDYDAVNNVYYAQTNDEGSYSILKLDADFNIIEDLGSEDPSPGYNFQDFCYFDGYLLQSPLTWAMGIGEYLELYSLDQRAVIAARTFAIDLPENYTQEPECFTLMEDGSILIGVMISSEDRTDRQCYFYSCVFPYINDITSNYARLIYAQYPVTQPADKEGAEDEAAKAQENAVIVTAGTEELLPEQIGVKKSKKGVPALVIVLILLGIAAAGLYAYVIYVRRQRAKTEERIRAARRKMMEEYRRKGAEE